MSGTTRVEVRIQVAEGHWALGEHQEALRCIQQALEEDATHTGLATLLVRLQAHIDEEEAPRSLSEPVQALLDRVRAIREEASTPAPPARAREPEETVEPARFEEEEEEDLPPLASATLAELLAEQGLTDKALRVARGVLDRNPNNERAQTLVQRLGSLGSPPGSRLATLERWLANVRQRRAQGGVHP